MKRLLLILFLFISAHSFGQFINNGKRIFNVKNFGAKGDSATNETVAFKNCMAAVYASGNGVMYIPAGIYTVDSIRLPAISFTNQQVAVEIQGESSPNYFFGSAGGTYTWPSKGSIIRSANTTSGNSVILCDPIPGTNFSFVNLYVHDLEIRTYDNPSIGGLDAGWATFFRAENLFINTSLYSASCSQPTHSTAGLYMPRIDNGAMSIIRNITVVGYNDGILDNEHTDADGINVSSCINGVNFQTAFHSSRYGRLDVFRCTNIIKVSGVNYFSIAQLNIEHDDSATVAPNYYQVTQTDVLDVSNNGKGDISWHVVKGNVGIDHTFTKSGGTGIQTREMGATLSSQWTTTGSDIYYTTGKVGVGISSPAYPIDVYGSTNGVVAMRVQNATSGTSAQAELQLIESAGRGLTISQLSPTTTAYGNLIADASTFYNNTTGGLAFMSDNAAPITFATGTGSPAPTRLSISGTGVFTIPSSSFATGTTTDSVVVETTSAGVMTLKKVAQSSISGGGGTPGGSTTQVQYNSSGAFAGDGDFLWDATNHRLGIGLNAGTPLTDIHVHSNRNGNTAFTAQNGTSGTAAQASFIALNDGGLGAQMSIASSGITPYSTIGVNSAYLYTASTAGWTMITDANAPITFATGTAPATERLRVTSTGMTVPGANGTLDLGSSSLFWRAVYLNHPITGGTAPSYHSGSKGTNVTSITVSGTDAAMHVIIVTSGSVTGTIGSIDYGTSWGAQPKLATSNTSSTGGAYTGILAAATSSSLIVLTGNLGTGTYEYDIQSIQ